MMNRSPGHRKQKGVALILSLLLLFVLLLLGVAGFNSTHVQERSASNHRLQTIAFEAASAGANNAINFYVAHRDDGDVPDQLCGATNHEGWGETGDWIRTAPQTDNDFDISGLGAASVTLSQRLYCLNDEYYCSAEEEAAMGCIPGERPKRSQLFVHSRGEVNVDGKVVAMRDVEVRLEVGKNGGGEGDGCGAICFPGCDIGTLDFGPSNQFTVDGEDGPAITTDDTEGCTTQQQILDAIKDKRLKNYEGGVEATGPHSPWDSVADVEALREATELTALEATGCDIGCWFGNADGTPVNYSDNGNHAYGTAGDPQITYIDGNAEFGGGVSGAGILMVNGNLLWNGTPQWTGLIVVLGGTFEFDGGGTGGDWAGSVVVVNAVEATGDVFGQTNFAFSGGGTAEYSYSCETLMAARDLLNETGQNLWNPECNAGPAFPYQAGPDELIIASWRENIGWREREEYFAED